MSHEGSPLFTVLGVMCRFLGCHKELRESVTSTTALGLLPRRRKCWEAHSVLMDGEACHVPLSLGAAHVILRPLCDGQGQQL